ncbi:hypothetical protein P691DRAFT_810738, partial [Macrolepiota fuliginosa MF-IS2]
MRGLTALANPGTSPCGLAVALGVILHSITHSFLTPIPCIFPYFTPPTTPAVSHPAFTGPWHGFPPSYLHSQSRAQIDAYDLLHFV